MRLLVTGGAGYIGSVVAAQLLAAGHEVVVLDDLSTGHADAVPTGARFVHASLLDAPLLAAVFADGFDGVLHFAAKSLVGESVAHPEHYWRNNVIGTFELLEAMVAASVPRLVFSSTAAVYGEPDQVPILLGERHATETHLIPIVLQVAEGRRAHVQIYGTDYPTPDGTAIRDYIHVEDLARAHLLALDASKPGRHAIYNLGNGLGSSVREVIEAARRVTGRPIATVDAPRRPGDPAVLVASSARIGQELGWTPHKPAPDDMVGDAWACLQGHGRERV